MATRRLLGLCLAIFLAMQVAIPTLALFSERPARFGWQMYAAFPTLPDAWLVYADGREETVDLHQLFAVTRAEIDYAAALRASLCEVTDVAAIRIAPKDGSGETVPCR